MFSYRWGQRLSMLSARMVAETEREDLAPGDRREDIAPTLNNALW
jgi:hypothetical protein